MDGTLVIAWGDLMAENLNKSLATKSIFVKL